MPPVDHLEVIGHQRKARPAQVANPAAPIERIGFLVPRVEIGDGNGAHLVVAAQLF